MDVAKSKMIAVDFSVIVSICRIKDMNKTGTKNEVIYLLKNTKSGNPWITKRGFIVWDVLNDPQPEYFLMNSSSRIEQRFKDIVSMRMIKAVSYCHRNNIILTQITPRSFFWDGKDRIVLHEFGASMRDEIERGTFEYHQWLNWVDAIFIAPEYLLSHPVVKETDLWSLGATVYWVKNGKPLFEYEVPKNYRSSVMIIIEKISSIIGPPSIVAWAEFARYVFGTFWMYPDSPIIQYANKMIEDRSIPKPIDDKMIEPFMRWNPFDRVEPHLLFENPVLDMDDDPVSDFYLSKIRQPKKIPPKFDFNIMMKAVAADFAWGLLSRNIDPNTFFLALKILAKIQSESIPDLSNGFETMLACFELAFIMRNPYNPNVLTDYPFILPDRDIRLSPLIKLILDRSGFDIDQPTEYDFYVNRKASDDRYVMEYAEAFLFMLPFLDDNYFQRPNATLWEMAVDLGKAVHNSNPKPKYQDLLGKFLRNRTTRSMKSQEKYISSTPDFKLLRSKLHDPSQRNPQQIAEIVQFAPIMIYTLFYLQK